MAIGLAAGTAIAGSALGIVGGIGKMIGGGKRRRAIERAMKSFKRQELKNINEGRRGVSTRGADIAREEAQRGTATSVDALQSGGIRGVVGGLNSIQEANNNQAMQIGAGIDQQQLQFEREYASDEARLQGIRENRDNQELAAMQAQLNAATQDQASGLGDISQSLFAGASLGMQGERWGRKCDI
jgi:hypothetical protein